MKRYITIIIFTLPLFCLHLFGQSTRENARDIGSKSSAFLYSTSESVSNNTECVYYKITLNVPMDITISTCGSTVEGNAIEMQKHPSTAIVAYGGGGCSDGLSYLEKQNIQAGTYYILFYSYTSSYGYLSIEVRGTPVVPGQNIGSAIDIGNKTVSFTYADTKNTANYNNQYQGRPTNDVFYKFRLTTPMDVTISHCGSSVSDTYLNLLNSSGTSIAHNDDYSGPGACSNTRQAYLKMDNLAAGTYYVVSEGYNTNGNITTTISGASIVTIPTPTRSKNYTTKITPMVSSSDASELGIEEAMYDIQYFDGIGRPIQQIQAGASSSDADLVTFQEYDVYGRESNNWLPVIATANKGAFIPYTSFTGKASSTYPGENKPYGKSVYENSPQNRMIEEYGPGQEWHNTSRSLKSEYLRNIEHVDTLNCIRYDVSYSSTSDTVLTIIRPGNYSTGELYVNRIINEDGHTVLEFKDKLDRLILTRQIDWDGNGKNLHDTYYIYDDYGNLSAILPPILSDNLVSNNSWNSSEDDIAKLAYLYSYDHRNRCIAKKLPGCSWTLHVYDKADRLIFTQDGNQRHKSPKEWSFTLYDLLDRLVLSGVCTNIPDITYVNSTVIYATYSSSGAGPYMGYNIFNFNPSGYLIHLANYYDHYKFRSLSGFLNGSLNYDLYGVDSKYLTRHGTDSSITENKGLLTGTATAVLNNSAYPTYLYSVMYYDYYSRVIQTKSTNHLPGGIDKEYLAYNFIGQPEYRMHIHSATGKTTQTELYTYTYDKRGRPLIARHKLNARPEITLANNFYDNLGRLLSNERNNRYKLITKYTYNIRSWMKSISTGDLFRQTLYYNDSYGGNKPLYSGNISAMNWTMSGNGRIKGYKFSYDGLSRLKSADYMENATPTNRHSTSYSYDKHGNITRLVRNGLTGYSTYGIIDDLTLYYNGNQLTKITDTGIISSLSASADFRSHPDNYSIAYFYDANGNLVQDFNKDISNITYNSLNLPGALRIGSTTNTYMYAADGRKLRVTKNTPTDYVGNVIYENGMFKRLLVDGGYYDNSTFYYYISDHLGNNRIVADSLGNVKQTMEYYPFGMAFADGREPNIQPYKYNNKELDSERGLNWYDYSARYMDPAIGRFTTIDPLAEDYYSVTPYAYVQNNPLRLTDPNGMQSNDTIVSEQVVLPTLVIVAPKREPVTGFWGNLGFILNNGNYDGYKYNKQGEPIGFSPITGMPSILPSTTPLITWKKITEIPKIISVFRNVKTYNSVKSLITSAGKLNRLKHGVREGTITGDINTIFNDLATGHGAVIETSIKGEKFFRAGNIRVGMHISTRGGGNSLHINDGGQLYKIRIK